MAETGDDGVVQAEPVRQPRHNHEDGQGLLLGMRVNVLVGKYSTQASSSTTGRSRSRQGSVVGDERKDGKGLMGMGVNVFVGKCPTKASWSTIAQ